MNRFRPAEEQLAVILRGVVDVYRLDELKELLSRSVAEDRPLRVKFGMDPTAPDIHLGHTVPLRKLRQLQDLGHQAVLVIGDYTAVVGDPSGRSKTRPRLSPEEIEKNLETYLAQVSRVLDTSSLEIVRNGDWFSKMDFKDVLELAGSATVAQIIERDDFSKRFKAGNPIGVHELLYPLMQGWDSVEIRADIELGGTDQTFNLMAGRDLQKGTGQTPQVAVTTPILVGTDGTEKMSKSLGNSIDLEASPQDMFGKIMSISDSLLESYFELLTMEDMEEIHREFSSGSNPRNLKERLGKIIVAQYHDEDHAERAAEAFRQVFSQGGIPEDIETIDLTAEEAAEITPVDLIMKAGHAASRSEAKRLIQQGALHIDSEKVAGIDAALKLKNGSILKTGKRRFARITIV